MKRVLIYKISAIIFIAIIGLFFYHQRYSFLEKISLSVNDYKYKLKSYFAPSEINKDIVIVAIDEKSINKLGRWPWGRKKIAELFSKLKPAAIVGLDIVFSEPSNKIDDNILADVIMENGNIIGGVFFRSVATETANEPLLDILSDSAIFRVKLLDKTIGIKEFQYIEPNIPEITESLAASAFFTIEPDLDGLYRNYPFFYLHKGLIFPSLGMQMLRFYLNTDIEATFDRKGMKKFVLGNLKYENANTLKLNFYNKINYISAYDILNGVVKDNDLKNKIVIVGVTETGIFDLRPTPIDTVTPGVSLHATFISNFLDNNLIFEKPIYNRFLILLGCLFVFLLSFIRKIIYRVVSYIILFSILYLTSIYLFIHNHLWLNDFYFVFTFILSTVSIELILFILTDMKAIGIKKAFSSYVSPDVVEIMTENPDKLKLGGETREITIIFTDIRGFTTLSEGLKSEEVVYMLNQLNSPLTHSILKHKGLLDKYIGDAIMAIFNAPVNISNHADMACKASLEMLDIVRKVNEKFKTEGLPTVDIGIGINTGIATVGNIGSDVRFDYTAIGDPVNLASRLEGLNKIYKTHIIISEFVVEKLQDNYCIRLLDKVIVKGKEKPVTIYQLLENSALNSELSELFSHAIKLYFSKQFDDALIKFEYIYNKFNDQTSAIFIERCKDYMLNPPEENWNGAYTAKTK
ncbi:adenylate/guanylate cyclase domain-containing protein [Deferribacterales bacterium Es71-Z0220]|jgi:adenylate cyclase|uniref:CHASE2 domain-containing protein n=1 Tax=Deferrivibrio essentukiensis TaxID=2880922 RepID=UPI001F61D2FF|nr:adenylate/guanylate cyclase domain-containing protein [Deferrivibrio essentukiensis]MBZ4672298.1 adenylate/guanylate cyclase with Chase sensor [Deferribacteraceae bacterium]MCB4204696.1 adenylate/guanylate cyclase domain-containing protein [Deferrivibrio essentukiensis]